MFKYSVVANWPNGLVLKQVYKRDGEKIVSYMDIREEDVESVCELLREGKKVHEQTSKEYEEWMDEQGYENDGPPVGDKRWV